MEGKATSTYASLEFTSTANASTNKPRKTTTSDAEHAEEGCAEGRKERMHSSTHYAEVLTHTALPPDVPHSPSNMESFEILMDDDVRRIHDARSKTPVMDVLDGSRSATPPRSGAASAATLAWDPYDSRLVSPINHIRDGARSPIRPRSATPPIPAWAQQAPSGDVVVVDSLETDLRCQSPDFSGRPRSSSPDLFVTSTPLKGISPGRPKPGSSRLQNIVNRSRRKVAPAAVAPSPLVIGNTGVARSSTTSESSDGQAEEKPLYTQVQRQPQNQVIRIRPSVSLDSMEATSPSVPIKTSSSRVLEETLSSIAPPPGPPPASQQRQSTSNPDAASPTLTVTSNGSTDQLNETSPYAEVMYQGHGNPSTAAVPSTPPLRKDSMPAPVTAKSVTFHTKLTNDYLLAADSQASLDQYSGDDEIDSTMDISDWIDDPTHLTPLHYASALGKRRYLTLLLKQLKRGIIGERSMARLQDMQETTMMRTTNVSRMTDVNCMDGFERTALMHAVHSGYVDCARVLLHEGASVNIQSDDGSTALHVACFDGNVKMVSLLLHHGADAMLKDSSGRLPLHWATAPYGRLCVQALLKKVPDLDVNVVDSTGMTPLMWAAYHESADVVEELLRNGAERSLEDQDGLTACHWAIHPQDCGTLKILLDTNSVRTRDNIGKTLAHMAAEHGSVDCMNLILACWPQSIHQCDDNGRTPLHWATVCEHPNVIRTLLVAGGDPSAPDRVGRSPRDYAGVKKLRYCQVLLSQPKAAGTHDMSLDQLDAGITGEFNQRWSQWLADGCVLGKYTHDGRGPIHKRFFWVDIAHTEICWSKDKKKKSKDYTSAVVVDIIPGASDVVLHRADYDDSKRYHLTVLTTDRSLDLIAKNSDDHQCWLQGLRCLVQMKAANTAAVKK